MTDQQGQVTDVGRFANHHPACMYLPHDDLFMCFPTCPNFAVLAQLPQGDPTWDRHIRRWEYGTPRGTIRAEAYIPVSPQIKRLENGSPEWELAHVIRVLTPNDGGEPEQYTGGMGLSLQPVNEVASWGPGYWQLVAECLPKIAAQLAQAMATDPELFT